jgi:hypothetical protein
MSAAPAKPKPINAEDSVKSGAVLDRLRPRPGTLGATGLFALVVGVGLLMVSLGNTAARESAAGAQPLFWGGLIVIYLPITFRLFSPDASRAESLSLALLLGAGLYMVKVLYNPIGFIPHDEMASFRQAWELLENGRFFSDNPIVQGYAGYPGLQAFTAAVSQLSEFSLYVSGTIVIGAARLALILGLFLFLERVSDSHRVAGIGVAVYACNPSFLYFDSQFGYESLALALAVALLLLALRWVTGSTRMPRPLARGAIVGMAVLAATLVTTHHLSSYAMLAFFLAWAATIWLGRHEGVLLKRPRLKLHLVPPMRGMERASSSGGRRLQGPLLPAGFIAIAGALWFTFVAGAVTTSELGHVFTDSFSSVFDLITGQSGSKELFAAGSEETNTAIARTLGLASIIPLLVVIPFGLWRTWFKRDSNALWRTLSLVALLYPATLGLRLTAAGTETSQRASEFVFVGLAFAAGLVIAGSAGPNGSTVRRTVRTMALAAVTTIVFLGGFIVGESPLTRQPGPYLVSGESRSVTPQILAAAKFANRYLPPRSRILVDRVNATILGAFGHLDPVIGEVDGIKVSRVFFSKTYDRFDQKVISEDAIDYIVVDRRFIETTPAAGFYYEKDEPSGGKTVSREALAKFADLEGLERVYDDGAIVIYDTAGLRSLP